MATIGMGIGIFIVTLALEPDEIRQYRHIVLPMNVVAVMMVAIVLFMG